MPIASMPMYDLDGISETRAALDDLWRGLVRHLGREGATDAPAALVHGRHLSDLWTDPTLWLSQCCGYDLVNRHAGALIPIAVPHYDAPECAGPDYASVIVVRDDCPADDVLAMRGAVCVINGWNSHSGMNALRALVAPASTAGRFFSRVVVSGTHAASLETVRRRAADVAAIDCVSHALLARYRPGALSGLRKLGRSDRAPGIPYVTRATIDGETVARMRGALVEAFADPALAAARQALLLKDLEEAHISDYDRIAAFARDAARHGYPALH